MRRILLALALVGLASGAWAEDFIRYTPPNPIKGSTGWTFDGPILAPDGTTCTAPAYTFSGQATTGISRQGTSIVAFCANSGNVFNYSSIAAHPLGIRLSDGYWLSWSGSSSNASAGDTIIGRDGANNTLAMRNGTTGQEFRVYNTWTDADNKGYFAIDSNTTGTDLIGTAIGTGTGGLTSIQGGPTKALTAGAATAFVQIAVPQTDLLNFASGEVLWTVRASDATDIQTLSGVSAFNCVNKTGTETCAAIVTDTATAVAASAGAAKDDLACTITAVTGLTDVIQLAANCATAEMTETSLVIYYTVKMAKTNTVTPQT